MQAPIRFFLVTAFAALSFGAGCGDDEDHHHGDGGHHHHGDGGHSGSCGGGHVGAVVECDDNAAEETLGATAEAESGATAEVTEVMPSALIAGEDGDYELMVQITDAEGSPIEDAELSIVHTMAHGEHASCGAPEAEHMGDGVYHVHGLTYPHGGTWYHTFTTGDDDSGDISLALCVENDPAAEGGEHGGEHASHME